ncbi:DUF262 domain-containing protein [Tenacibaculum sp. ZH5_bin.1]|uniref:DUF262 domain-containing protein n=1 Tax=unclassified Tenacibaculum TaxID=2635139 RepID=UPI0036EB25E2
MSSINTSKSNVISFYKLLNQEEKIEIPIIQRDYAQGRYDKQEIRRNFLKALLDSISLEKEIQLDFIYGSRVKDSFQPLDGQQRLTTLFLLHWYAMIKDKANKEDTKKLMSRFSYETRITSREFCFSLISNNVEFDGTTILSEKIRDSKWFFLSWKNDPTIDAMLRTIDDIHDMFYGIENLWRILTEENLISFYHVELKDIGLTDDLYIKMNARGKLLSSFENFKASFENYINNEDWEFSLESTKKFAFKIDTDWTDFFWNNFRKDNNIDKAIMRFISTIVMIRLSIERHGTRIHDISNIRYNPNYIKPELITKESYEYIYKCFEIYQTTSSLDLNVSFPFWRHKPSESFLKEVVFEELNASYTQRVLFFAQTEYLLKNNEFKKEKFDDWMRVVRNIVSRGNVEKSGKRPDIIRSPETFDGVINLISEISEGSSDIYNYLCSVDKLNSTFAKEQIEEEKIKAKLIISDIDTRRAIFKMEDKSLFRGRIDFVLKCVDYKVDGDFDLDKFNKIYNVINLHFDNEDLVSNDLRRALLTIEHEGEYRFYDYWKSYWYYGDATKRCLIDNFRELEYYIYGTEYYPYIKKLILKLTDNNIDDVIVNFSPPEKMPNWQVRLIKEPELLDKKNKSNYIAIPEDNGFCYLLKSIRPRDLDGCEKIE